MNSTSCSSSVPSCTLQAGGSSSGGPLPSKGMATRIPARTNLLHGRRRRILPIPIFASGSEFSDQEVETDGVLSDEYSRVMQSRMGGSLSYEHDRGMNYTRITPQLIVGSCLQSQRDAQLLRKFEKVRSVLCLQQDSDMAYFDLDLDPVLLGCDEAGIDHLRCRVNDFDPYHLRLMLPDGVALLAKAMQNCKQDECVYVHCTAGLGRAPGIAIAYMYWVLGMSLTEAHQTLTSKRPCHPKLEAIANATGDLLFGRALQKVKVGMKAPVSVQSVHVAGLDMGWDNPLPCKREGDRFVLERELPTGRWQYKFIVDGRWTYNADSPTVNDNGSVNNYCDVMGELADEDRRRLVLPEPKITSQEREKLKQELAKITPKNS